MSDVSTSKKLYYAKLRKELKKLNENLTKLDSNLKTTAEQVPSIRKMGTLHSSMLMSVQSVIHQQSANDYIEGHNTTRS
ncbi:hypothetical protein BDF20DRAFT_914914 [Mycotypha africana]|uniref:uncharacterized protein n=1 Tax=Mycotypha africana TaxID=64632 RepID=UPI00230118C9|nr:uncharacterized protein BDF20DRAFT_914914 [Mycotypha africana]KAI8973473.1 hypothetical protein BDF20DRAFT_914914 [Mycotypha africana]